MRRGLGVLLGLLLSIISCGILRAEVVERPLWLVDPAISPDGETVAFTYRGVLYRVPVSGGDAVPLTSPDEYVCAPCWSPDGKRLAYGSDRYGNFDIFTISADGGSVVRVTQSGNLELPMSYTPAGDSLIFRANYLPSSTSARFYTGWSSSLYRASIHGGGAKLLLTHPARNATYSPDGHRIIFEDIRGNEDGFRKHHTSAIARDVWTYEPSSRQLRRLVAGEGEDRNPVYTPDGNQFYFLSEREGRSFNIYLADASTGNVLRQVTDFKRNPVRNLSISRGGKLCFRYDGEIYTMDGVESKPVRLKVRVSPLRVRDEEVLQVLRSGAGDGVISPNGKEVAFVVRGDVYVANIEHGVTQRITNTPTQERSVTWDPSGKALVYAGERDGSWNLYRATIAREDEPSFSICTEVKEEVLLQNSHNTFQPVYAPNGKEVAFLEDRTKLRVIDVKSKKVRDITDGKENFSYSDGDLNFSWSPDSKWFVLSFNAYRRWPNSDIGLVSAAGGQPIINITRSGYTDAAPRFAMGGDMIIWMSDRLGLRSHASWGSQDDVYAFFTTKEAYDKYRMTKFESESLGDKSEKKSDSDDADSKGKKKGKKDKEEKTDDAKDLQFDLDHIEDRIVRLTVHSSYLADAIVTPDGKSLYYLSKFESGYDLWKMDLKERSPKRVLSLNTYGGSISVDKDGKNILISAGGSLIQVKLSSDKQKRVSYACDFTWRPAQEREYMFRHAWQQVADKFYRTDLHGVDWKYYREVYEKFLPHVDNNYDFADLLSEMLGELNASHTGAGYRGGYTSNAMRESSLGLFFDRGYDGPGLRVTEVLRGGPFDRDGSEVKAGTLITRIDGQEVSGYGELPRLLNNKRGERLRVEFKSEGKTVSEVIKPISMGSVRTLMYKRWVQQRRDEVERLSGGRLGYVHIEAMDGDAYHDVYSELFGLSNDKEGVIVDTRYNGGGHMHENIEVLFSGQKYLDLVPRDHWVSEHPRQRWKKPSVMLMSEANYSNAHGTPWVYKTTGIGKLVGRPVPGTMTSVWWETQIDPSLYFGVPIVGYVDRNGNYLENQQLEPDVMVELDYLQLEQGHDTQIEGAVQELLRQCDQAKKETPWPKIEKRFY